MHGSPASSIKDIALRVLLAAILILTLALQGACALLGGRALVPDLTGISLEEAAKLASDAGLTLVVAGRQDDASTSAGSVASQVPAPGEQGDKGSALQVFVCAGEPQEITWGTVPDVSYMSSEEAV
jgi:beta-lactam-binding protein with PASTA domain